MQPFTLITGIAAPLPAANLDTDIIMPKMFLKGIDRSGLAEGLFHHLRKDPDFILNRPPWTGAKFLVTGPNFGCGSSREHAVWGMVQLGIRAVIGSSFGGIFFDNCLNNGILALTFEHWKIERLLALAGDPASCSFTLDLLSQLIIPGTGPSMAFTIDPRHKDALVRGMDPIAATLEGADEIRAFERGYLVENPWLV